jgi:DNA-binding MarR family transcriptional regulator
MTRPRQKSPSTSPPVNTAVLLREASTAIDQVVPLRLAEVGHGAVRAAHGPVFQHLDDDGTTVSALAQRAGTTKQAMAELVQHLERHGYVRRVPDPTDGRAKLVQLTDTGRDVMAIVQELVPRMEKRLLEALGQSRWRQLRNDLQEVQGLFGQQWEAPALIRSMPERKSRQGG